MIPASCQLSAGNENDHDKICNYYFQSCIAPVSASVSSDPWIRHKHTYAETRVDGGGGGSPPLIILYKNKGRQPLTLLVVWETRCNQCSVPGAGWVQEGGSAACKSTQTDHCEYISDEHIIYELYLLRQREAEMHRTVKVTDETGICCCQGWSLGCAWLVFPKQTWKYIKRGGKKTSLISVIMKCLQDCTFKCWNYQNQVSTSLCSVAFQAGREWLEHRMGFC